MKAIFWCIRNKNSYQEFGESIFVFNNEIVNYKNIIIKIIDIVFNYNSLYLLCMQFFFIFIIIAAITNIKLCWYWNYSKSVEREIIIINDIKLIIDFIYYMKVVNLIFKLKYAVFRRNRYIIALDLKGFNPQSFKIWVITIDGV